ncbi:MAG: transglycosylase SLT domain-containing protein [Rubellimicrobium sp.]|nr:transglycosylase SLT domain-containing protein [Rubellimicrobium sp.]
MNHRKPHRHQAFQRAQTARIVALACGLLWSAQAGAADDSALCLEAAVDAARINPVPVSVLVAITLTETGRARTGVMQPWPWTVNIDGVGHWFDDRQSALAFAEEQLTAGHRSFDVGCFQVNYRWHGDAFNSLAQMFDPLANASYAAGYLARLHTETGDWSVAAGAYHSRTPEFAQRYRARFDSVHRDVVAAGFDRDHRLVGMNAGHGTDQQAALLPRQNSFPLLQATEVMPSGLGSLVPLADGG